MNGLMVGWMNGWIDGLTDWWIDGRMETQKVIIQTYLGFFQHITINQAVIVFYSILFYIFLYSTVSSPIVNLFFIFFCN